MNAFQDSYPIRVYFLVDYLQPVTRVLSQAALDVSMPRKHLAVSTAGWRHAEGTGRVEASIIKAHQTTEIVIGQQTLTLPLRASNQ